MGGEGAGRWCRDARRGGSRSVASYLARVADGGGRPEHRGRYPPICMDAQLGMASFGNQIWPICVRVQLLVFAASLATDIEPQVAGEG